MVLGGFILILTFCIGIHFLVKPSTERTEGTAKDAALGWKGMTVDTKTYVVGLLESYQKRSQQIDLLHYELSHPAHVSANEVIGALAISHSDGNGHPGGHASDKTLYIALNYQNRVDQMNHDASGEVIERLVTLERERFVSLVRRYTSYDELTAPRLNEFIEKVVVHEADKSTGDRRQKVDIYFNFIGCFVPPKPEVILTAVEEAKAQKALAARNREREQNRLRMRRVREAQRATREAEKVSPPAG